MAKKNRTICIVLKNDVEYFEEFQGSFFRQLVKDNGLIGTGKKAVQCAHAWLVEGSGAVLADWHKPFAITNVLLPPNMSQEEFEAALTQPIKAVINPAQTEDPVERIKRQAKARIAPADMSAPEPANSNGFPKPQPWVEPTEAIDL